MNPLRFPTRCNGKRRGFTLVEVCLSMGIMTVTLVPLLGLMANGLVQVGSNMDSNQAVNISQEVFTAARQMPFAGATGLSTATTPVLPKYFTAEGDVVATVGPTVAYTAYATRTLSTVTAPTPPMVTVVVTVRKTPGGVDPSVGGTVGNYAPIATFVGTISCSDISGYNAGTD